MDDRQCAQPAGPAYLQSPDFVGDLSVLHADKRGYSVYQNTRRMLLSDSNPFFFKRQGRRRDRGAACGPEYDLAAEHHHARASRRMIRRK